MNYAATQILHVYKHVKKEQQDAINKVKTLTVKPAFGAYYIEVKEAFEIDGVPQLKFKDVGYGSVNFLGNINGLSPRQGLFYKNENIKKEIEYLIISLEEIEENKDEVIKTIGEAQGKPIPEHSILWFKA